MMSSFTLGDVSVENKTSSIFLKLSVGAKIEMLITKMG